MADPELLLRYTQEAVAALRLKGEFNGGQKFKLTQKMAFDAFHKYLNSDELTTEEKLKGFFQMPTSTGKTAFFLGLVDHILQVAEKDGVKLRVMVVEPTILLTRQTAEAAEEFAPEIKDLFGFYVDKWKNLRSQITMTSFPAWDFLTAAGVIGSHNIDILISDESHRGLSDQRKLTLTDHYNACTLCLAFTATAYYDKLKSVLQTHAREIFGRLLPAAIRDGEGAAYIQSQRAIIRVDPLRLNLEGIDARDVYQFKRRLKQKAWNLFAVEAFRKGRDQRTGDWLTDNQVGFLWMVFCKLMN